MTWSPDSLKTIEWEDLSPPNLMMVGDVFVALEAEVKGKGLSFSGEYPGAEDVFERLMLGDLDVEIALPIYRTLSELVLQKGFDGLEQSDISEVMESIYLLLKDGEEDSGLNVLPGSTSIELSDQSEQLELVNFVKEALEQLSHLENQLPELRLKKNDGTFLNTLFRRIHTIKGASGFFGLVQLTQISHELENVMDKARNGALEVDDEVVSILVRGAQWMSDHLNEILELVDGVDYPYAGEISKGASDPVYYGCMAVLSRPEVEVKVDKVEAKSEDAQDSTIHISQTYLDQFIQDVGGLLNLAHIFKHSETVLSQFDLPRSEIQRFKENFFALEEKTDSLQKRLMTLRRVKVKELLDKVPKIVFRLMQVVSKKVEVEIEGDDIEIDRSMLSVLEDPFVHILRNSMDHGIETPEDRIAMGKPESGLFKIRVYSSQTFVHIEITDDGKGIDGNMVANKALEKGLITDRQLEQFSMQQKQELIFMPGFSTQEQATEISGRGVGMDVVKSKIVEAGGSVSLKSQLGKGTVLTLTLPMAATLSTRSLLRVSCSGQWIGIPMEKVDSISSIECHSNKLSKSGELELFPYRGKGIPVVNLNLLLGLETTQSSREHRSFIVIRELMDGIALEVDDFSEFETHVIQDFLEGHFDATPFGGASVMGDGAICLMLSIDKVLQRSKLSKMDYVGGDSPVALQSSIRKAEDSCVLVFQPSEGALFCSVDMGWVSRIETFNAEQLKILKGKKIYSCNMGLLQYFELSDFGLGDMVSSIESISTVLMIKLENRTIALGIYKIEDMYTGPIRWLGRLQLPMIQNSWSYSDQLVGNINLKELSAQFQPSKHLLVGAES